MNNPIELTCSTEAQNRNLTPGEEQEIQYCRIAVSVVTRTLSHI